MAIPLAASNAPWLVSKLSCQPGKSRTTYSQDILEFPLAWLAVAFCRPRIQLKAMPFHRFCLQGFGRLELGEVPHNIYQKKSTARSCIPVWITETVLDFLTLRSLFQI